MSSKAQVDVALKEYLDLSRDILKQAGLFETDVKKSLDQALMSLNATEEKLEVISNLGLQLGETPTLDHMLDIILLTCRKLTNADAGTVYLVDEIYAKDSFNPAKILVRNLVFKVLQNSTMNTYLGGGSGKEIGLPPVELERDGKLNISNVSTYCVNQDEIVNLPDVYNADGFDFSGTKAYDEKSGYRSKSMLVIPLKNQSHEIVGVLQLINRHNESGEIISFSQADQELIVSVALQISYVLYSQKLVQEHSTLFNSFIKVIAEGLGEKSPHTYEHIRRVAEISVQLSEAINGHEEGIYEDIQFSEEQLATINLAGWMHDIGKITTPEHIVAKKRKLQGLCDKFELVIERCNSKIKDLEIACLKRQLTMQNEGEEEHLNELKLKTQQQQATIKTQLQELYNATTGQEALTDDTRQLINTVADATYQSYFEFTVDSQGEVPEITQVQQLAESNAKQLLNQEEKDTLLIERGTLSTAEREIIKDHASRSWRWLMNLPFPKQMKALPLYAGAHHEHLNGTGYPNQLVDKQLPIQARILIVADLLEALSCKDRPYRGPMKLNQILGIIGNLTKNGCLDAEIMRIFLLSTQFKDFVDRLDSAQVVELDVQEWIEKYCPKDFANTLPNF